MFTFRNAPVTLACAMIACGTTDPEPPTAGAGGLDAGNSNVADASVDDAAMFDAVPDGTGGEGTGGFEGGIESGSDADAAPPSRGWLALVGGGSEGDIGDDTAWSADVYGWIVEKSGHGRVAILAAEPQSDFLSTYFTWLGAAEAVDVTIGTGAEAADPQRLATLAAADAIFIKGGDQARYLSAWQGSEVPIILSGAFEQGKVLAGTSAGAHVLGGVIYDASNGSVRLDEAVRDAWNPYVTFTQGFLDVLPNVVLDTHFTQRGRLARLAPMLARLLVDEAPSTRLAIGLDDRTGLLIDPQAVGEVRGEGSVTVLRPTLSTVVSATPGAPVSVEHLGMNVFGDGYRVDLETGDILTHPLSATSLTVGDTNTPASTVTLDGSDASTPSKGSVVVVGSSPYALVDGELTLESGEDLVPGFVMVSRCYGNAEMSTIENRIGGVQWALRSMGASVPFALFLDVGGIVEARTDGTLEARPSTDASSTMLLDGRALEEVATSPYAPRQSVSLVGLELNLLAPGDTWTKP